MDRGRRSRFLGDYGDVALATALAGRAACDVERILIIRLRTLRYYVLIRINTILLLVLRIMYLY